ncbi:MAG TPA: BTAD domain-containing putative transcriptional regulator [Actinomycetota bacterium]
MRKEPSAATLVPARDVRIRLLGAFAIWSDGTVPRLPSPAQRLASFLAMRGEPTARAIAAGTLWPEVGHDHALANLRTALWRLRGAIPGLVHMGQAQLHLDARASVDLHRSRTLAERILQGELPMCDGHGSVADLSADLLPDLDDEWLVFERERFRDLRIHALERLSEQLSAIGEHADAVQCGLLAVEGEPLRESAHRALMRAYIAEENRASALQQFQVLERRLDSELQVGPSIATMELALELRTACEARALGEGRAP